MFVCSLIASFLCNKAGGNRGVGGVLCVGETIPKMDVTVIETAQSLARFGRDQNAH